MGNSEKPASTNSAGEEKNLQAPERELPQQKTLIWIASAVGLIALIAFGFYNFRQTHDEFSVLRNKVVSALEKRDEGKLLELAQPDFAVAQSDADVVTPFAPATVMKKILKLTDGVKWSDQEEEIENYRFVTSLEKGYILQFHKPKDQWQWVGFMVSTLEDVQFLTSTEAEVQYSEIPSDEAPPGDTTPVETPTAPAATE